MLRAAQMVGDEAAARPLWEIFEQQVRDCRHRLAYTFRAEDGSERSLTFGELAVEARAVAAQLAETTRPGDRALLVYPAGLEFVSAFFGCVLAGVLAVPATYPRPRRPMPRLTAIAQDCNATVALTTAQTLATLDLRRMAPELVPLRWIATDAVAAHAAAAPKPSASPDDLVFLQYTSGSTSHPKGVMVSNRNLLTNLEMIRHGFGIEPTEGPVGPGVGVFWLPAYHDMGLIGGILMPMYTGGHSVLMAPTAFLQRPLRWLEAISQYRAIISGGPNFAYDLCVRKVAASQQAALDLSCWRVAFCGAEPIRIETLDDFARSFATCGFRRDAFYPCYGLAEATLLAAGDVGPAEPTVARVHRAALASHRVVVADDENAENTQRLVACGGGLLGQEVAVVDPHTGRLCPPGKVGEIWIRGGNVAAGYWDRPEMNAEVFNARLTGSDEDEGGYLRTGDLGFLHEERLFVTGRLKDVIIIRGRNYYPHDLELTVQGVSGVLIAGAGAAFGVEVEGEERLAIVQEIDRQARDEDLGGLMEAIRRSVTDIHEAEPQAIVLIRQASLPRTTSGKVQRILCRQSYLDGSLKVQAQWVAPGMVSPTGMEGVPHDASALRPHNGNGANGNGKAAPSGGRNGNGSPLPGPKVVKPKRLQRPPQTDHEIRRLADDIERWLLQWLVARVGGAAAAADRDRPLAEFGLDSMRAVELAQELEDWLGVELTPVVAWNYPTPAALSAYLARVAAGLEVIDPAPAPPAEPGDAEFERLLAEVEQLDEQQVEEALRQEPNRG